MFSRRQIRLKVLQLLYEMYVKNDYALQKQYKKELFKRIQTTKELLIFFLKLLVDVVQFVQVEATQRKNKNFPTPEDINFNTSILNNSVIRDLIENTALVNYKQKYTALIDPDWIRIIYLSFTHHDPAYETYIQKSNHTHGEDKDILKVLFYNSILGNDSFVSYLDDLFPNFQDDITLVEKLVVSMLSYPLENLTKFVDEDKISYAGDLLDICSSKKKYLDELIKPKLVNWDIDRIPVVDIIIIEMALSEFLYFETIPLKVTINEYLEIIKEYSTPKSAQFLNGILDNIKNKLLAENKIIKKDFTKPEQ
ncbi:MAG: transcription antitermination factor NusB [Phycisphaerales bacterium]|nr:transcription antitermination factor NusB [Phycisphaerales bacterium]